MTCAAKGVRKGDWWQFRVGHRMRLRSPKRYRQVSNKPGRTTLAHRLRAEQALGKPLPEGACVHHADGTKSVDSPLVICPSLAYHNLLHARMRIQKAGGNPNTDRICCRCKSLIPLDACIPTPRLKKQWMCRPCKREKDRLESRARSASGQKYADRSIRLALRHINVLYGSA